LLNLSPVGVGLETDLEDIIVLVFCSQQRYTIYLLKARIKLNIYKNKQKTFELKMKKLSKLKSFADFKNSNTTTPEITSESVEAKIDHKSVITKQREKLNENKVNEAAFKIGNDFKVKVTVDVPVALIQSYIQKVTEETGKNALDNFSESELAEQMVQYVVKQNLHIDSIPSALSVGDQPAQEISAEQQVDAAQVSAAFGDEQELNMEDNFDLEIEEEPVDGENVEEIEITDGDLSLDDEAEIDTTETEEESDVDDEIELESDEEVAEFGDEKEDGEELNLDDNSEENLGEERDVENDGEAETEVTETEEEETEEEEETMTIGTETGSKTIEQMKRELAGSGLDPRFIEDDLEIVDLWNEIFMPESPVAGTNLNGEVINPSEY
jgi:hypothetical protein